MSAISTDDTDPQSMLDFMGDLLSSFFSTIEIFEGEYTDFRDVEDVSNSIMAFVCVLCAGLAAGLTMGLLSLDTTKLEIKNMTGTEAEQAAARTLLPIVRQHHLLLVTLLLFNSMANEALPIFLGALVPNYMAVILSVVLILFFGEIIPSAFFTGPQQLLTAARMAGFVWGLMAFFSPISWPIAKVLDCFFGADDENKDKLSREDLGALMILHGRPKSESIGSVQEDPGYQGLAQSDGLHQYEVSILTGMLSLSKTSVGQCMIDIQRVFALEASVALTQAQLRAILASGFSRIPVYKAETLPVGEGVVWKGYLLTKTLIALDAALPLSQLSLREPLFVRPSLGLLEMLAMFRQGQCHLAMVSANPMASLEAVRSAVPCRGDAEVLAIVTLEDVIEKILQADIHDETDVVDKDLFSQSYKHGGAPTVMFHGFHKAARTPEAESSNRMRQLVARASRDRIDEGRERALFMVATGGMGAGAEKSPAVGERSQLLPPPAAPSSWLMSPLKLW